MRKLEGFVTSNVNMTPLHSGTAILKNDREYKLKDYSSFGHIQSERSMSI